MAKKLIKIAFAALIYIAFAFYLYAPYFQAFKTSQYLLIINLCLASLGCFLLSQRWITSFAGLVFAGAIYGFGPFFLGLAKFHPIAGLLAASIPWLLCPAAFGPKARWRWLRIPIALLPFLVIILFFKITTHYSLFAIPIQSKLHLSELAGLLIPLVTVKKSLTPIGFYHIPIAPLILGFSMLFAARRFGVIAIFIIGTILAFCDPFFNISPIIWLTLPMVCCSVLAGAGLQGLVAAGFNDKKWLLVTTSVMAILSVLALLFSTKSFQIFASLADNYAILFVQTAKMYILGTVTLAILFFMARAKLRAHWLRLTLLCSPLAIDVFLGA